MTDRAPAKLPIFSTILDTYRITTCHAGALLRFGWPWFIILIVASGILYWSLYPLEQTQQVEKGEGSAMLVILSGVASTFIGAMLAVPWHRMILLGEEPKLFQSFDITSVKLRYAATAIFLAIATILPIWILLAATTAIRTHVGPESFASFAISLAELISLLIYFLLINRLMLAMPAIAIERADVGIGASWRATHRNAWRMFVTGIVATIAPYIFIASAISGLLDAQITNPVSQSRAAFTAWSIATECMAMLVGMLIVTFLSLAFRHFFGSAERTPQPAEEAPQT